MSDPEEIDHDLFLRAIKKAGCDANQEFSAATKFGVLTGMREQRKSDLEEFERARLRQIDVCEARDQAIKLAQIHQAQVTAEVARVDEFKRELGAAKKELAQLRNDNDYLVKDLALTHLALEGIQLTSTHDKNYIFNLKALIEHAISLDYLGEGSTRNWALRLLKGEFPDGSR